MDALVIEIPFGGTAKLRIERNGAGGVDTVLTGASAHDVRALQYSYSEATGLEIRRPAGNQPDSGAVVDENGRVVIIDA